MIIAIDGASGSGKSTIARELSRKLSFELLNTGLLYRKVTSYCLQNNISYDDEIKVVEAVDNIDFSQIKDAALHNEDISLNVPHYAKIPSLRHKIREYQRSFSKTKSIVVEGRDIGSVVFPDADVKLFITASLEERAKRRQLQLGNTADREEILENLRKRDEHDTHRESSPLIAADDAFVIDTTDMSVQNAINKAMEIIARCDA